MAHGFTVQMMNCSRGIRMTDKSWRHIAQATAAIAGCAVVAFATWQTGEMRDGVFVKSEDFIGGGGMDDETH